MSDLPQCKLYIFFAIMLLATVVSGFDFRREAIEWGSVGVLGLGAYGFSQSGPFFEEPLIGGETDAPLKDEQVPKEWLGGISSGVSAVTLTLIPTNDKNRLTHYRHIKGYVEAIAAERLLSCFAKDLFGSPRPDADEREFAGYEERDIRDSFPSGHTSYSFVNATYLSLYLWTCIGNNESAWEIAGKSVATSAMLGAASWVGWTRVEDNVHRPRDVVAGAILGTSVAAGVFMLQEGPLNYYENLAITPTPDGIYLTLRF